MRSRAIRMGVLVAILGGFAACGGDDGEEPPANGDPGDCPKLEACGGDPVGEWSVGEICVGNPEEFVRSLVGNPECRTALKDVSMVDGSGTYSVKADKSASSTINVTAAAKFSFNDACVKALQFGNSAASECAKVQTELEKEMAVESATCMPSGSECACDVSSKQTFTGMGSWTVAGTNFNVSNLTQPFCVSGSTMKLQTTSMGVTVQVTMSK